MKNLINVRLIVAMLLAIFASPALAQFPSPVFQTETLHAAPTWLGQTGVCAANPTSAVVCSNTLPANTIANFGFNNLNADNPTFSLGVNIVNPSNPFLYINDESVVIAPDAHAWNMTINDANGALDFQTINDAGTVTNNWLIVGRTGNFATNADFIVPVTTSSLTTAAFNIVGPSNPFLFIDNSSLNSGQNLGAWDMTVLNTTGTLQFNALGDTSGSNPWMSVTRTGFVPQLVTITPPLADTSSVTGDTAGATWVNTLLPGSLGNTPMMAISTTTANYSAGLFATKTSLNAGVGQSLIAATFLNYANNTTVGNLALTWGAYYETVVAPSSTFLQAFSNELSSANQKANSGVEDPYTPNPASLVVGSRYSAGIGAAAFNASAAIDIVPNGAKYWSGIIVNPAALDTTSGYADAYATGVNAGLSFYSAASTRAVKIFLNDATTAANAEQVIFGNNVLDIFINGGAYHALAITSTAVGIGGGSGITTSGPGGALTALAYTTPATGIATFLTTPTSANLAAAITDETGTGKAVFATSPTFAGTVVGPDAGTWGSGGINSSIIGGTTAAAITGTTINATTGFSAGGTSGVASKTCTINTTNVTTGITITIKDGIITGTTTC